MPVAAVASGYPIPRASCTFVGAGFVCIIGSEMAYYGMHRTTLVLDERKLKKARRLLGTKGIKDTIERALDEVIAYDERRRAVDQLRTMEGLDLDDPEIMARAWR